MKIKFEEVLLKIEMLRNEMNYLAELNGINDPRVLESSQRLDKALNQYNRIKMNYSETMLKTG